jgi:DNA-cytosine methyltransferase
LELSSKYKILDLFSGLGGFSLGLERTGHFETVAFCDNDKFSKLILDKHWKGIKVYEDVREITKEKFKQDGTPFPDIITGGFPCQPFSVAGKQKGTSDDRHLWPEMFRIIKAFKPRYVIGENVRGIINIQDGVVFETVCTDLESEGYEVQPFIIPAASVGAPHRRERVWIVAVREDVGDTQHNGLFTNEIGRRNEEINGGTEKRQNGSVEFEGTSRSEDNATMENSNNNGLEGRLTETRNETITREEPTINGSEDTDNSSRRSDGRGDQSQPRVDGAVQGLRDGNEEEFTRAARVRGLHERADNSHNFSRENGTQENDSRALVQERQSRVQSSVSRGLGKDQTSFNDSQVRQGNDNATFDRVENGHEDVANTRRALWSRSELQGENGNETREGNAHQLERSSSASEFNVADTNTRFGNGENEKIQSRGQTSDSSSTRGTTNVADTVSERGRSRIAERQDAEDVRQSSQSSNTGWWDFEPNVGRVAHGVSGRVHRLKGLGNSIVPQIVEEIGKAIIKAEKE